MSDPPTMTALIDAYLDGSITDEDAAALERWIESAPPNARLFSEHALLGRHLTERARETNADRAPRNAEVSAEGLPIYRKGHEPSPKSEIRIPKSAIALSIAASLLAACGVAIYLISLNPEPSPPDTPEPSSAPLANLIENASEGTLTTPGGFISEGRDYPRGEYALDKGTAEFMLTNAVNVKLRGRSRMIMHDDMHVSLTRGSAEFVVPKDAKGFAVHLPDGLRVVDLGTRFSVDITESGGVDVRVITGAVEVYPAGDASASLLSAGQVANLTDGRIVRVVDRPLAFQIDFNGEANPSDNRGDATGVVGPATLGSSWNTMIHNQTLEGLTDDAGKAWPDVSAETHAPGLGVGSGNGFALESDPSTLALTGDFLLSHVNETDHVSVTIRGLPAGDYDLYVIAGNIDASPKSHLDTYRIEFGVGESAIIGIDLGPIGTDADRVARWTEGANYIKQRIAVADGQPLTVRSRATRRGYSLLNGIQIVSAAPEIDTDSPEPGTDGPTNPKETQP